MPSSDIRHLWDEMSKGTCDRSIYKEHKMTKDQQLYATVLQQTEYTDKYTLQILDLHTEQIIRTAFDLCRMDDEL
jgi:O-methyltransferase involved in polyketide biosynthesis